MPEIIGQTQEEAQSAITRAGLVWGTPTRAYSNTVVSGSVISCKPPTGTAIPVGQAVTAVISRGVEQKTVPDVVGRTEQEARTAITDAGLTVGAVTNDYSPTVESGKVISSDPAAGTSGHFYGDSVSIVVSKGSEMVTVPDVSSMKQDEAVAALKAAGLVVKIERVFGIPFISPLSTNPAAGTSVRRGLRYQERFSHHRLTFPQSTVT